MATQGAQAQPQQHGYEAFFGLKEPPFSLAPDPRFLFSSASHTAALSQVAYALERREPLVVVTGEIGTGKTLLCRTVLQRLQRKTFLSVIADPLLERDELLKQVLEDFGVISKDRGKLTVASRHELVETLHAFLRSLVPIQAHAVVIIDEAQHLNPNVLEQIRLLSNVDDGRGTLLQMILVGQTDLDALLARPELRQLQQRITRRFRLEPLTRLEVQQYIEHRLALAQLGATASQTPGASELARALAEWSGTKASVEFAPAAIESISEISRGLPRVVNLLCDRSLEQAYESRARVIDTPTIHAAARALRIVAETEPAATPAVAEPAAPPVPAPTADGSFWAAVHRDVADRAEPAAPPDQRSAEEDTRHTPSAAPRARHIAIGVALLVAAVAIWFGVRAGRRPAATAPPAATQAAAPQTEPPRAPTPPSSLPGTQPPNGGAGTAPAAASTPRTAAAAGTPAATTGERFEIVVASFRTDSRATSVATDVAALNLPVRRRVSDGWQQVICGPFGSRSDAENAQARLQRAGIGGTQIVAAAR